MREAICLAQLAQDQDEVPVGAVVVDTLGHIVGRGANNTRANHDPTAHAEILALRAAGQHKGNHRLTDCVLVVTLEPCIMCLGAIIQARLAGVVFAATDPKAGCLGSLLDGHLLSWSNHSFWVVPGILAKECSALLSTFFKQRRQETKILKNVER